MIDEKAALLLLPGEVQVLERLRFTPTKKFAGRVRGERTSKQKGISVEFSDFRDYAFGDDLRRLDWSILARLDRPTIKTYHDEDDLAVTIALDTSASMDFGTPTKFEVAQKIAAALGFVGLSSEDAVYPFSVGAEKQSCRALRGRASFPALGHWIAGQQPMHSLSFAQGIKRLLLQSIRPGLIICITDALDAGAIAGINALGARGNQTILLQILSPMELNPAVEGDLRILDAESGEVREITANAEAIGLYLQNLDAHCLSVENAVRKTGGCYLRLTADSTVLEQTRQGLRRSGLIT